MKATEQQKIKTSIPPRLPGVEYDEDGLPVGQTVEELTNRLTRN